MISKSVFDIEDGGGFSIVNARFFLTWLAGFCVAQQYFPTMAKFDTWPRKKAQWTVLVVCNNKKINGLFFIGHRIISDNTV